jgi:LytS/YehU family sensor histidine kinase
LVQYLGALVSFTVFIATYIYFQTLNLEAESKLKELLSKSNRQRDEIEEQRKQLVVHNRELNIRALSAQMNPHFLYNSLNAIQHFLTANDKTSSLTYLSKFGKLIRQFIDYSDKGMIPLADELKLLKYYLELESLRFASMFHYRISFNDDLLLYNISVPLLLIQTHVENAILHGLLHRESNRQLSISFTLENDVLLCVIEDNGVGREASKKINRNKGAYHRSRGIDLSTQRLRLMYEDKGYKDLVDIVDLYDSDGAAGTRVEIRIPFESI